MNYLLDTNVIAEMVRAPRGPCARRVRLEPVDSIGVSIIAASEIQFGLAKGGSADKRQIVLDVLQSFIVVPFEAPADQVYGELRWTLTRAGHLIGGLDMLIAAHALALGCTLVTANEAEFRRVPDLRVENWIA